MNESRRMRLTGFSITHGGRRDAFNVLIRKPKENKDLNVFGRIILKMILGY
jgi:hypothetical protein